MNISTRSRRPRQRPRAKKVQKHQEQSLLWPEGYRPVFRQRQVRVKVQERGEVTSYGGLALAHDLAMRLELDALINRHVGLLRVKLPYFESDHVLTHVYNLFIGGHCIEDISHIQHSEAIKHLTGACRIPDPTTAGDFLRRFHPQALGALQAAIDEAREKVWNQLPRGRKQVATIDMDSTIKEVYGECKQGADFSHNRKWSYHPLLLSLAQTNEPLRTINRSGNSASADGAAAALSEVLPMVKRHFSQVYTRGDSKFYQRPIIAECEQNGVRFALAMDGYRVLHEKAENQPQSAWKPFSDRPQQEPADRRRTKNHPKKSRRKRPRHRRRIARRRGYRTLSTTRQWVAELTYTMPRRSRQEDFGLAERTYRLVVKRQRVEVTKGQEKLFDEYRYRFIITNIPKTDMDAGEVLRFAYGRCDQENTIEQLKNGIAALRMPTGELLANDAFLKAGQLAWCLRSWLSLLALPRETLRWQWSWFRHAFVYVAAKITKTGRRAMVALTRSHRFIEHMLIASERLHCFEFG